MDYFEYIVSKEWKVKSKAFIKLVGNKCENCGGLKNLGSHHKTYKNLGNETKKDILVWCWHCHNKHHIDCGDYEEDGLRVKRYIMKRKRIYNKFSNKNKTSNSNKYIREMRKHNKAIKERRRERNRKRRKKEKKKDIVNGTRIYRRKSIKIGNILYQY